MGDRTTPNLPSRDLDATAAFYAKLGFEVSFKDEGWMFHRVAPFQQAAPRGVYQEALLSAW